MLIGPDWLLGSTEDMPLGAKSQPRLHIEGDMVRGQPQQNKSESRKMCRRSFSRGQVKGGHVQLAQHCSKEASKRRLGQSNEPAEGIEPWTFSFTRLMLCHSAIQALPPEQATQAPAQALLKTHLKPPPCKLLKPQFLLPDAGSST